jgi:hypothetical protein
MELLTNRYRIFSSERRIQKVGDLVLLDQAFTSPECSTMVIAYSLMLDGNLY